MKDSLAYEITKQKQAKPTLNIFWLIFLQKMDDSQRIKNFIHPKIKSLNSKSHYHGRANMAALWANASTY